MRSSRAESWATKHQEPLPTTVRCQIGNRRLMYLRQDKAPAITLCNRLLRGMQPEHILQQINLMRSKVVEVAASGNISLHTPGKIITIVIQIAWRLGKTNLYIDNVADRSVLYYFLYFLEIGKITSVVCYETGNPRFIDMRLIRVHSSYVTAIGFSIYTGLPAFMDIMAYVACEEGGVAI